MQQSALTGSRLSDGAMPFATISGSDDTMIKQIIGFALLILCLAAVGLPAAGAQTPSLAPLTAPDPKVLQLSQAIMCETIENFKPVNRSVVFPVSQGTVMCFTDFDVVAHETEIYHLWINRDTLVYRKRLILKPPRWASVSSIKLREADKGPWRVEIRDVEGRLLTTLRFSITD